MPNWPPLIEEPEEIQAANMPDDEVEVDFEDENAEDSEKALEYTRTLKLEYAEEEVEFWFTQIENEMFTCGVKSQWLKRCVLVKNLPSKIQADVKALLGLKKSAAPTNIYKQIKDEILRIHAPQQEQTFKKALSRVLTGLPSQLGQQLINDICKNSVKLSCGCCANAVYTLWTLQLPLTVRSQISNMKFDRNTYHAVFQAADNIFLSTRAPEMSASVAAVVSVPKASSAGAVSEEVGAVGSGNRGGARGNRNGRGRNQNRNAQNARSGTGGGGSSGGSNASGNAPKGRGTRHASGPPSSCCDNHYRWGADSWFCLAPLSCPWKDKIGTRPEKKN